MPSGLFALFQGRFLLIIFACVQAVFAAKQSVAVLPSDGEGVFNASQLKFFTDKAQEIAVKVLPKSGFEVFPQEVVIKRLGGFDNYYKECKESSCIVELGRKAIVDYVARCSFTKLSGSDFTVSFELYDVSTEGLIDKFVDKAKNADGLVAVMQKKIPDSFMKIPGAAPEAKTAPHSVISGISGLKSGADDEFGIEQRYLANFATEPTGAVLSFNGIPAANCIKTPCSVELAEDSVRIIAVLDQYETADTTVSIKKNNQNVNIRLKPNFGVLEIKPAYSEGIGKNENWSLTINNKTFSSLENRLSPGNYSVRLSHKCYEDISFDVGINNGSSEVFYMANHVNLKDGGLVLSAEKDGEPVSEPVFVNGQRVGETPFSGSVAVCSEIGIGAGKEKVNVKLEHKQIVRYVHKVQIYGTVTDKRDGKKYKTVKIGSQTWMAENLNYAANGSKCYDNKLENCKKYGRLYDWTTAMTLPSRCNGNFCSNLIQTKHRDVCPSGWHLPNNNEWTKLMEFLASNEDDVHYDYEYRDGENQEIKIEYYENAGKYLKAKSGQNENDNAMDTYGFSALLGGVVFLDGSFKLVGYLGYWWSASEFNSHGAYYRLMSYGLDGLGRVYWHYGPKDFLQSVRCVRD